MQSHYIQSSLENATPSSGTYPIASFKGVPPPPRAWGMEHLISLEERDKAGVLLSQVHWPLETYIILCLLI